MDCAKAAAARIVKPNTPVRKMRGYLKVAKKLLIHGNQQRKPAGFPVGRLHIRHQTERLSDAPVPDAEISVLPDVFSPDGDGTNDFAEIYCQFQETGNCVTIDLYDRNGLRVRRLAANEPAGYEARYRWDGTTDDQRAANSDIYLVHIQLWNPNGQRKSYRRTVALVRRE